MPVGVSSFFTSILAARSAVSADERAAFRADIQQLLEIVDEEEAADEEGGGAVGTAGCALRFLSAGGGHKPAWFVKELGRRAKERRATSDKHAAEQVSSMLASAVADGLLLEVSAGAEPEAGRRSFGGAADKHAVWASGPALTGSILASRAASTSAREALVLELTGRTREAVAQVAWAAKQPPNMPPLSIPLSRANFTCRWGGTHASFAPCRLGFDCSTQLAYARQAHVCSLFSTEREREVALEVFARHAAEGMYSHLIT